MNFIVIGSKGFIGSHCVNYFRNQGHNVVGCDIEVLHEKDYVSFNSLKSNFNLLFKDMYFDICINAAGSANVSYSFNYPEKDFQLNVSLLIDIMAAIKANCPDCKFINFSSAAVYGNPSQLPIKENAELKPLSPYGYHKMLSEKLLAEYHRFFNLKTCSLRVFSAYGPGLKKQLFWDIYQKAKNGNEIHLYGTGKESRDFIYIDDLIRAVDIIIQKAPFKGECINVSSGIETSIAEAAQIFLDHYSNDKRLVFNEQQKEGDPINWRSDTTEIRQLGFDAKINILEGIRSVVNWLKIESSQN
jgi:UDP-glucose 4-epimerase